MGRQTWAGIFLALILSLAWNTTAAARSYRHHRRNPVVVALQPFLVARSAAHALVDPIVFNAPRPRIFSGRLVAEDAPQLRLAYYSRRTRRPYPPRAQAADAIDEEDEANAPRRASADENVELSGDGKSLVAGSRAILRNGVAHAPSNAPANVKQAIWATNTLRRKPYTWGGGHGSFDDRGYDCSGTVSFALHHAGLLATPLPSSNLMSFGERGRGRWITIYARPGHTFAVIAGLRLDTTDFQSGGNIGPRWHADMRETGGFVARHPTGL
ncbi:MAG: hypothetical protein M3Y86_10560 [Verrucomicrobiota bacterium]|nr:hypothetical protein [Verrucomicrobiota bacterium]